MDKEVARLWLNSTSLGTTLGATGIRTANNKELTFKIDMRIVLGEALWSKYEYFKMYFTDPTPSTGGLNVVTIFQNGLNLIQSSYMGNTPGFNTPLSINNTTIYSTTSIVNQINFYEKQNNLNEFVMIKPDTNNIQLVLTFVDEVATGSNQTLRPFFITFVPYEDKIIYKNPYNYLFQNEQVNFTLSTTALVANATNQNGTMNTNRTIFTFTNVNLRNIIGTLWDKYDKFNLIILNWGFTPTATVLNSTQNRMFFIMDGLQMINTLAVTTGFRQGRAFSPLARYQTVNIVDANYFDYPGGIIGTFRKPESEQTNLDFEIWNAVGGLQTGLIGNSILTFSVIGVPSE
jgi:hypothetical protein